MKSQAEEVRDEMIEKFRNQPTQIMKEEKIKYTESVETIMPNGLKRWIKIKVSGKGMSIEEAAMDAKTKFDKAFMVAYSHTSPTPSMTDYNTGEQWRSMPDYSKNPLAPSPTLKTPTPVINLEAERVAILIENATELADLHRIWDKVTEHQLTEEYEKKLTELSK